MPTEAFTDNAGLALLYALGVVVVFTAVAFIINFIVGQSLNLLVRRHNSPLQSVEIRVMGALRIPILLTIVLYGVRVALNSLSQASSPTLDFISNLGQLGHYAWIVSVAAVVCYTVSRLIVAFMRWYSARAPHDTRTALNTVIWPILIRITSIVVFTLGALVALDLMGIPITPLLAGLGIGGLAVALALSPTISSFIAGTYVVAEGHISEGDYIEIDSERAGFVISVGWRSTVLRSRFNNVIVVPNSLITESIVTNYATPSPAVTGSVENGVSYESDLKHVEDVSLEVARKVIEEAEAAHTDFEPVFRYVEFADSNINFRIVFQGVDRAGMIAIKHEIIKELHARFQEEGIEINYPVRKLTAPLPETFAPADELNEAAKTEEEKEDVDANAQPSKPAATKN
ncbi:MAG: mechanosensitive ion channel family protein [Chloroflexi bacterium]|nr:mechanosensitive ion channel family protein [Chloroflexota bacterium]